MVALGVLLLLYPVVLIVLGYVLAGQIEERVRTRLAYALRADDVKVEDVSVSLLRGRIEVEGIHAERTSMGMATVDIGALTIEVAGLGMALFDDTVLLVDVQNAHLQLSAVGAATLRQSDGPSLEVGELTMSDSSVTLVATSLFPSVGKARLVVNKAHAEQLVLNNAMSWLYKTDELDATVQAPGDFNFGLIYLDKEMSVSGSIFGSKPVTIPFSWPIPDPRDLELEQILDLATSLSKRIAKEYAERKAKGLWDDVTDVLAD
jgi:hypothetical protein